MTIRERVEAAAVEELPSLAAEIAEAEVALRLRVNAATTKPKATEDDPLLTTREVAAVLNTSYWNAGEMIRRGILPSIRVGAGRKSVRVRKSAVEEYKAKDERRAR